jgi:hypothetical protein
MKQSITAKNTPNKNIFVAVYQHSMMSDGKRSRPFLRKSMQQIITAQLKLTPTPEQFQALREIQLAYRDALNAVSHYAFTQGKTSNVTRLHKGMYAELRTRYRLPSQLACSVERQVAATYKGLWTKLRKNAEHRRAKITKKRFKGLDQPPHYSSPTVQYTYERDYTFQCDGWVSIGTLNGRISVPYQGYEKHIALIRQGGNIGDAKLWYDQPKKTFYLLVSLSLDVPDPTPAHLQEVVGVDVGMRYLAVTSTQAGKRVRHQANHDARLRKRLQQKGTRGAKRRVRRIERRERRLKLQANHTIAKGAQSQSRVLPMVLCRVACPSQLQSCAFWFTSDQGGCGLHIKGMPCVWAHG